jgi:hypothetical protein
MIRYRALFEDLTGLGNGHGTPERDRVAEIRERSAENNQVTTGDRELLTDDGEVAADGSDRTVETPR